MPSAYLLVSHGSRDPRPQAAMEQLSSLLILALQRVRQTVVAGKTERSLALETQLPITVGTAYLELNPMPLHEQIIEFADRAIIQGYKRIEIVPLFLLAGVHVKEDIPAEVAIAQKTLGQAIKLDIRPYLGTHPGLIRLLANKQANTKADGWIMLAHGSRRAGAKEPVQAIAQQLGALFAYWAFAPGLESQVQKLVHAGCQEIGIIPYFLFAGGITDAIAQKVDQLQEKFPSVRLHLAQPLGVSQELVDLILDLVD